MGSPPRRMVLDNFNSRSDGLKCRRIWNSLLPHPRRLLQQIGEMFFPQCRVAGGAVPARVAARRDEHGAPVLHAPDLALEDSELAREVLREQRGAGSGR